MPRPSSIVAMLRKLIVLRWRKLTLNTRLAIVATGVLTLAALMSSAWGCPTARRCGLDGAAETAHPALAADVDGEACPFARPSAD